MLIRLMLGVRQFQNDSFKQMQEIFKELSIGQKPEILFITCSDSRLMPNLLTQTKPGELFTIRNVGNIIPPSPIPSSEGAGLVFALNELDSIKDIIICGHSHCGAMKGLLTPNLKERLPEVASWLTHSHSVLKQMNDANMLDDRDFTLKVNHATKLNILLQIEHLKSYPLIAEKLARKELNIHGWFYELETGEVLIYEPQYKKFIPMEKSFALAVTARKEQVIEQVAMNFLKPFTHPQTVKEYRKLIQLFSLLENNLLPIWEVIKIEVRQKLWVELAGLYSSIDDGQFNNLMKTGYELKLNNLKDFQKNIMESQGYQQYMRQMMRYSLFSSPLPPITMTESLDYEPLSIVH
ncbi:carbonic anhydrase [Legionella anisa]|uniref:carbonic anhydrase n=1 Tax=Legionella anisa TaxID=28082 RepID=A0AAX0WUD0_9GAMM|nr:carbonic anhydrase [Legionella anisa]AWN75269.1 carbonic anhydrase [Legionella anisa]KTC72631.1 carbonic anhydrase [Legionella anisa]MBN5936793.1 carbonic anhydrase [Legionella anisa]MCW8424560.1 carbonic anhydrase [Legionella anisa]MCW8446321.1 carbonic anhydrase [Legionella anisa]